MTWRSILYFYIVYLLNFWEFEFAELTFSDILRCTVYDDVFVTQRNFGSLDYCYLPTEGSNRLPKIVTFVKYTDDEK